VHESKFKLSFVVAGVLEARHVRAVSNLFQAPLQPYLENVLDPYIMLP
jgi:hypothetical protein